MNVCIWVKLVNCLAIVILFQVCKAVKERHGFKLKIKKKKHEV